MGPEMGCGPEMGPDMVGLAPECTAPECTGWDWNGSVMVRLLLAMLETLVNVSLEGKGQSAINVILYYCLLYYNQNKSSFVFLHGLIQLFVQYFPEYRWSQIKSGNVYFSNYRNAKIIPHFVSWPHIFHDLSLYL